MTIEYCRIVEFDCLYFNTENLVLWAWILFIGTFLGDRIAGKF